MYLRADNAGLLYALCFSLMLIAYVPLPSQKKFTTSVKIIHPPILQRMLSATFHTGIADRLWLEGHTQATQTYEQFSQRYYSILTLDPGFISALNYGSTFLASIANRSDLAQQLCDVTIQWLPDMTVPYEQKVSLEMGYGQPPDYYKVAAWVRRVLQDEVEVNQWMQGALMYAHQQTGQGDKIKEDLQWLLAIAKSDYEKTMIERRLEAFL